MEQELRKRRWIVHKRLKGWTNNKIASHLRISERTAIRWYNTYRQYGWDGLEIKSRAPHTIHKIPDNIVSKVVEIRRASSRNEYAIASYLNRQGTAINHSTVYRILKKNNLVNSLSKPRQQRTFRRFSRKHPNSLWQTDLTLFGNKYMTAFLDDHSRLLTGIDFIRPTTDAILSIFQQAIDTFSKPRQILTDHGTQYYDVHGGTSEFSQFCKDNKIKHILASIGHPQTTGKIERFFQTFDKEYLIFNSLDEFIDYYNNKRLHGGIGYLTPAEVYYAKK